MAIKTSRAPGRVSGAINDQQAADLTPAQREAIEHKEGPLLIVAGAGTGKTRVVTRRLAHLLQKERLKGSQILAMTFSNKATEEMELRLEKIMPLGFDEPWINTFHAFGERVLRDNALAIGISPDFEVLTPAEQNLFLKKNLFKIELDFYRPQGNPLKFVAALGQHFSRAKDEGVSPDKYLEWARGKSTNGDEAAKEEAARVMEIAKAYADYAKLMREQGLIDVPDLVALTLELLKKRPSILKKYQDQFKAVLVDEFQDTNFSQYQLVKLLTAKTKNLTVVADDDQAIYRWRGASVVNVLQFMDDFPEAKQVALLDNFRSRQPILDAAYRAVQFNNPERLEEKLGIQKKLVALRGSGPQPIHYQSATQEHELAHLGNLIMERHKKNQKWSDIAILVRTNSAADLLSKSLAARNIPFQFTATKGLYSRPEIIDLISVLRVVSNPHDSIAMFRVAKSWPWKLDPIDLTKLTHLAKKNNLSLFDVICDPSELSLGDKTVQKIEFLKNILTKYISEAQEKSGAQVLFNYVEEIKLLEKLTTEESAENMERVLNINQVFRQLLQFERQNEDTSTQAFVVMFDLMVEAGENPGPADIEATPDAVKIMTVHSAKGLEFPTVILFKMVERHFPSSARRDPIELSIELVSGAKPLTLKDDARQQHLAEERRLFYVACTRARDELILTSSLDDGGMRKKKASRFIEEAGIRTEETPEIEKIRKSISKSVASDVSLPLPKRFSYTQLTVFDSCPLQYKFAHIYKIPSLGSPRFSYGKSLHETLAAFYREHVAVNKKVTKDDLLSLLEHYWIKEWYQTKKHETDRKIKAQESLSKYFDDNQKNIRPAFWVEQDFKLKLGKHTLIGRIDRADELPDGSLEIIDYKTGSLKDEKKVQKNEQLALYALAAQKVFDKKVSKLTWYYLDEAKKVTTTRTQDQLATLEKEAEQQIDAILVSDFIPTPGFHCKFCDFKNICEAGRANGML